MQLTVTTLEDLIDQGRWDALSEIIEACPDADVADVLDQLSEIHVVQIARHLRPDIFAEIFAYLRKDTQRAVSDVLNEAELVKLLAGLRSDDRSTLLEALPDAISQTLLSRLTPEDSRNFQRAMTYPEESVGRLMTLEFICVSPTWSLAEALAHIQRNGQNLETINTIYVTDSKGGLLDALDLERFVLGHPSDTVLQIMDRSFVFLVADQDREDAVRLFQKYDVFAIPVTDADQRLVGVVTVDDVMDVAEEETTEDIQKGGGVSPLKDSYHHSSIWALYRKRVPWLMVLVFINLAASSVIAVHESTLAASVGLMFFIPLLMGAGGNTGAQSATLIVRALATGDLKNTQWVQTITKETLVGGSLGLTLALGIGWLGILRGDLALGLTVALAMLAIVVVSNLLGVLFPFFLTKLGLDPAVASSPMVTSTADVTTLWLYFSVAILIL